MRKFLPFVTLLFCISIFYGCDKERIVTTTETVRDTEYIELPADTVLVADTIYLSDSVIINSTDTLVLTVTDTLTTYDTVHETHFFIDTLEIIQNVYDTVIITNTIVDTVIQSSFSPDAYYAYSALQFQTDPAVLQYVNTEFGVVDGWILYLSSFQNEVTSPAIGVYDFYGVIDYWTTDWASYYPLEYFWRVTYTGGDPSDPQNWQLTDPPAVVNGHSGGVKLISERLNNNLK